MMISIQDSVNMTEEIVHGKPSLFVQWKEVNLNQKRNSQILLKNFGPFGVTLETAHMYFFGLYFVVN